MRNQTEWDQDVHYWTSLVNGHKYDYLFIYLTFQTMIFKIRMNNDQDIISTDVLWNNCDLNVPTVSLSYRWDNKKYI